MLKNLVLTLVIVLAIIGLLSVQKGGLTFEEPDTMPTNLASEIISEPLKNDLTITGFDCPLPGDGLHLENLMPNQTISFPYTLLGEIGPGHWAVFEAVAGSFAYFDTETNEQIGGQVSPWMIDGEWMTADPKPFSLELPAPTGEPSNGEIKIVFSESNAADESEHPTHTCEVVVNID